MPGHYQPASRRLEEIESIACAHGVGHLVLVQPSVYGTDNQLLLQALRSRPGRHRGVVVVEPGVGIEALRRKHADGVRGVRFNLVSPVGERSWPSTQLAPLLRQLGWFAQWYARPSDLGAIARWHADAEVACVLDHLAGMHATVPPDDAAWSALAQLAAAGAWVKLSGWYRLQSAPPYAELQPHIARVASLFGQRMVWGSDWPHTGLAAEALPVYGELWQPVPAALGPSTAQALRCQSPLLLYR